MGRIASELTEQEKAAYRHAWLSLHESRQAAARQAADQAMAIARKAAAILHEEFGVPRVWLFGSLARGTFGAGSDIDLAVDEIDERRFLRALGRLLGLHPDFPVDLVDLRHAKAGLRAAVERDGIPL